MLSVSDNMAILNAADVLLDGLAGPEDGKASMQILDRSAAYGLIVTALKQVWEFVEYRSTKESQ